MSFLEHLDELRKRIVRSCLAIAFGILATFYWIQPIFNFILAPTRRALPTGVKLIYTQPGEAFSLYITVALIAGAAVAAPFIMYQVWMFIAPGLYSNEKRMAIPFVLFTTVGFVVGASFNHYIAFPFMMAFFASFNTVDLAFMPKLEEVFGLYSKMLIGMGIVFQMPTVVYFLAKMKLITITPGMIASAVSASRQFSAISTTTAMIRRMIDTVGKTMAICMSPVVVSTSPVSRDRMPPVFISQSFGNGRCSSRSKSDRRSVNMTRAFSRRWR